MTNPPADTGASTVRPPVLRVWRARSLGLARYLTGACPIRQAWFDGHSHLVASREGLFAVSPGGFVHLMAGQFFGLAVTAEAIWLFEACDVPALPSRRGRILRIDHDGRRLGRARVLVRGLDNGCHQIALEDDVLWVVDTYEQRLHAYDAATGASRGEATPVPVVPRTAGRPGYVHMNALTFYNGRPHVLLHMLGRGPSVVLVLDTGFALTGRFLLPGHMCHDLLFLDDGRLLSCGSAEGTLIDRDGVLAQLGEPAQARMTRGLARMDDGGFVVGSSRFGRRWERRSLPGWVHFLDAGFRPFARLDLPAAPTQIAALPVVQAR